MEQLAARWTHNPKVGGSSPPSATKKEDMEDYYDPDPYGDKEREKIRFRTWDSKFKFFWRLYYWGTPFL